MRVPIALDPYQHLILPIFHISHFGGVYLYHLPKSFIRQVGDRQQEEDVMAVCDLQKSCPTWFSYCDFDAPAIKRWDLCSVLWVWKGLGLWPKWHCSFWGHHKKAEIAPDINPSTYGQMIFDKGTNTMQWGKDSLFGKCCWETGYPRSREWSWTLILHRIQKLPQNR